MNIATKAKGTDNADMRISIDNVPKDLKRRFKAYCAGIDVTMASALMWLMEEEIKERRLEATETGTLPEQA